MERKYSNPKDRVSTAKLDLSLFPDTAAAYGALAMTEGDLKYGGYNYRVAGVSFNVYVAAVRRHIAAVYNGEWHDPQTGVPHLANAIACLAVLIDAAECGKLVDDRPPGSPVGDLQRNLQCNVKQLQEMFMEPPKRFTWEDSPNENFDVLSGGSDQG